MDKSSLGYSYRGGASDVERTLKTVATGVDGSHTAMTEVSPVSQVFGLNFVWFSNKTMKHIPWKENGCL